MRKFLILFFSGLFCIISCKKNNSADFEKQKQIQIVANQKVINALIKSGDKLRVARDVFHWIYFKTEKDRNEYVKEVLSKRFKIVSENQIDDKLPYVLQIKRVDKVDKKSVDEYVIYLWEQSLKYNGDYDGWETSVEKDRK